jgi:hypothetical protein
MQSAALVNASLANKDNGDEGYYSGTSQTPHAIHLTSGAPFPPSQVYPWLPPSSDSNVIALRESHIPNSPSIGTTHGPSVDFDLSNYVQSSRVLQATPHMEISLFSAHVLSKPASAAYRILSFEMYQELRVTIQHTYILLEVQPPNGPIFFLRLNRAAGRDRTLWLRFRSMSSKFPAEDCVRVKLIIMFRAFIESSVFYHLIGHYIVERSKRTHSP